MIYRVHFGNGASNDYGPDVFHALAADGLFDGLAVEEITPPPSVDDVKAECGRRIYAIASAPTQINMAAAEAAGRLTPEQSAAFVAGLDWITAMRAACASIIAGGIVDYTDDAHWPVCPPEVVALANAF